MGVGVTPHSHLPDRFPGWGVNMRPCDLSPEPAGLLIGSLPSEPAPYDDSVPNGLTAEDLVTLARQHGRYAGPPPSLVTPETTVGPSASVPSPPCPPPDANPTLLFRHAFWQRRRNATARALSLANTSARRQDAFNTCGSGAWVLRDAKNPHHLKLVGNWCHDRFCEACAGPRRRTVARNLVQYLETDPLTDLKRPRPLVVRFLTLTLKSQVAPLADQLERLYDSFKRLRSRKDFRKLITGGVAMPELTYNRDSGTWHPHLHVIFQGDYVPQPLLKAAWLEITGDSYIVDVRAIFNAKYAAGYVAKYAGKAIDVSVWTHPRAFVEAIGALGSRRTIMTFGIWTGLKLTAHPPDTADWLPVGTLADVITRANDGDRVCRQILALLSKGTYDEQDESPPGPSG